MKDDAVIILDPVNRDVIDAALEAGVRDFIGGNCTVSLMLMALGGLFRADLVEWITSMTYQAASGAGAQNMRELVEQMGVRARGGGVAAARSGQRDPRHRPRRDRHACARADFPKAQFGAPLAGSLIPWIDKDLGNGQSREEWKGGAETNKILGRTGANAIPVDGICVRIGAMRCHSQAMTIKLQARPAARRDRAPDRRRQRLGAARAEHPRRLDRRAVAGRVSGTLDVPIGRVRKLAMGGEYLAAFTVGDQLLWGAAEPIRRMLRILVERRRLSHAHDRRPRPADARELAARLADFARERDWDQFHAPKNLAMALAGEAGELLEHFQWLTEQQSRELSPAVEGRGRARDGRRAALPRAPRRQARRRPRRGGACARSSLNALKYPVGEFRGSSRKYDEPA